MVNNQAKNKSKPKGKHSFSRNPSPGGKRPFGRPGFHRQGFFDVRLPEKLPPHVVRVGRGIGTENLVPGQKVYEEDLLQLNGVEVRTWDPKRSKLGAALMKGMEIYLSEEMLVLYLGVSSGTTASHVSDICRKGMVFGVDPAPRVLRDFFMLSKTRGNLSAIFADASFPERYSFLVPKVDLVYQDVAQRSQAEIFLKNCKKYLKRNGRAILMVKARSIDVKKLPDQVFSEVKKKLEAGGARIIREAKLEPFEKDHIAFYCSFEK